MPGARIRYVVICESYQFVIHDLAQPDTPHERRWDSREEAQKLADGLNYWLNFGG